MISATVYTEINILSFMFRLVLFLAAGKSRHILQSLITQIPLQRFYTKIRFYSPKYSVTMFIIGLSEYLTVLLHALQLTLIPHLFSHLFPQKDTCTCFDILKVIRVRAQTYTHCCMAKCA